jgi:hypothetical protein
LDIHIFSNNKIDRDQYTNIGIQVAYSYFSRMQKEMTVYSRFFEITEKLYSIAPGRIILLREDEITAFLFCSKRIYNT